MGKYTREQYVEAYCYFGWKRAKAESLYNSGVLRDDLVRQYLMHKGEETNVK
mgnify:CR=1 FL=1